MSEWVSVSVSHSVNIFSNVFESELSKMMASVRFLVYIRIIIDSVSWKNSCILSFQQDKQNEQALLILHMYYLLYECITSLSYFFSSRYSWLKKKSIEAKALSKYIHQRDWMSWHSIYCKVVELCFFYQLNCSFNIKYLSNLLSHLNSLKST